MAHGRLKEVAADQTNPGMIKKLQTTHSVAPRAPLRLGFVPLTDCAPLVLACELGFFRKHGLQVVLSRELGWASIRDKIIYGELEAAHALAAMPLAATLGFGSIPCECLTALVLNLHGNAITLSNDLWRRGVRDGSSLRQEIIRSRRTRTLTFGVVFSCSSHQFLLRGWLASAGVDPDRDVRIVVVPPPQMVVNLEAGHLDGFCVGEPWNSVAVQARVGWCVAASAELDPGHPEKVLMVRREFAERHPRQHLALVAALLEACEFCQDPGNREEVVAVLARPEYVNVSPAALRRGLECQFDFGRGGVRAIADFTVFYGSQINQPDAAKAAWVLRHLRNSRLFPGSTALNASLGRRVFRLDLFEKAVRLRDSANLKAYENQTSSETCLSLP
jgi:ABC-type nitrate/sulfonate/bicarbonate transport system substrate-binding protein